MDVSTVVGLRDRAIIAVMTYTFARVSAVVGLKIEDYYPQKKRCQNHRQRKQRAPMPIVGSHCGSTGSAHG
jgi:site-specific recombinase XerD